MSHFPKDLPLELLKACLAKFGHKRFKIEEKMSVFRGDLKLIFRIVWLIEKLS